MTSVQNRRNLNYGANLELAFWQPGRYEQKRTIQQILHGYFKFGCSWAPQRLQS